MTATPLRFFAVNAFAPTPHAGNQAGVVLFPSADDKRAGDVAYLTSLSKDFQLPMTAFVVPKDVQGQVPEYDIRWITPTGFEVPLCGHATLAAALALFKNVHPTATAITFNTRTKGALTATLEAEGPNGRNGSSIGLSLPQISAASVISPAEAEEYLPTVFAAAPQLSAKDVKQVATFDGGTGVLSVLVELNPDVDIGSLKVDPKALLPNLQHYCILVQILPPTGQTPNLNSRVFIPGFGVDEDPVCGSAHVVMTEFYTRGAGSLTAGTTVAATQASARGGVLQCSLEEGRVKLVGPAWLTASGELEVF